MFRKSFSLYNSNIKKKKKMSTLEIANRRQENRLSRRLTVDTQEPYISIRPIIKSKEKSLSID